MKSVHVISGRGVPLRRSDVDTDQIIPAEWLKRVERTGFEKGLFSTWRDDRNFVLNDERYVGASILVAGPSFGVGSSREHAVWAIQQGGFEPCPSFSDVFRNCAKNGLVPVVVPGDGRADLDHDRGEPGSGDHHRCQRLSVESPPGITHSFPMDRKRSTGSSAARRRGHHLTHVDGHRRTAAGSAEVCSLTTSFELRQVAELRVVGEDLDRWRDVEP